MNYFPLIPQRAPLAGIAEVIFAIDGYQPEHRIERIVPNARMTLVFELDGRPRYIYDADNKERVQECRNTWLSGTHSEFISIGDTSQESRMAAVQFAPARALPIIQQPLENFNDRVVPAVDVFGESVLELRKTLVAVQDLELAPPLIEKWLIERYQADLESPALIVNTMSQLLADPGSVNFTDLVRSDGSVSYKHFLTLFRKYCGPKPKVMQRILRFYGVFERLQASEDVDWASVAIELGYADQSHFVRDFGQFSGYRPQGFLDKKHDRVNFFPDDDP